MKILMVVTSHDELGNTGKKTGLWQEEFRAPCFTFLDAACLVTVASPGGGTPPLDPGSDSPEGQTDLTRHLATGQNPASSRVGAQAMVKLSTSIEVRA
jgi:hypothetical protein